MKDTPLGRRIAADIAENGPISVADYMARCLLDPANGYYTTEAPFGAAGDFVTAPEISQIFGEIVGAWLIHVWMAVGKPDPVAIVELGPGRGTLMADMVRVFTRQSSLCRAGSIHLVEASPILRRTQQSALSEIPIPVAWHNGLETIPDQPILLVANEFFDALPVRQFVRTGGGWRERCVGIDNNQRLVFTIGPAVLSTEPIDERAPDGSVLELRPAAEAVMAAIADRIVRHGGGALIIDYGHDQSAVGDTFQAVRRHAFTDPLAEPGWADLTAHVDFDALARAGRSAGSAIHGPMNQGSFLLALGAGERARQLARGRPGHIQAEISQALDRLVSGSAMGRMFKILALSRPDLAPPPFHMETASAV